MVAESKFDFGECPPCATLNERRFYEQVVPTFEKNRQGLRFDAASGGTQAKKILITASAMMNGGYDSKFALSLETELRRWVEINSDPAWRK
jgi:hypothetical protein